MYKMFKDSRYLFLISFPESWNLVALPEVLCTSMYFLAFLPTLNIHFFKHCYLVNKRSTLDLIFFFFLLLITLILIWVFFPSMCFPIIVSLPFFILFLLMVCRCISTYYSETYRKTLNREIIYDQLCFLFWLNSVKHFEQNIWG